MPTSAPTSAEVSAATPTASPAASPATDTDTDSEAPTQKTFTLEEVQQLLPHRYPFALVDRIIDYVPGELAVGIKNVTFNEPHFQGHFPNRPLMPGVLIVEAMAQVGGIVLSQLPTGKGRLFVFAGIDKVKFRKPVVPGDQLIITTELLALKRGRFGKMKSRAEVDGKLACEGTLMFSAID